MVKLYLYKYNLLRMKHRVNILLLLLIFLLNFTWPANSYALLSFTSGQKLFGKNEVKSSRLTPFPKWINMLSRNRSESITELTCSPIRFNKCNLEKTEHLIDSLKDKDFTTKLKEVNAYMNRSRYLTDPENWGIPDYWETPGQFFARRGDCEDYAIVKYMTLRALGISAENMRIVVLMDNNLKVYHSVLAVYSEDDIYILDNQIKQVMSHKRIYHYNPVFSINENYWWRHR